MACSVRPYSWENGFREPREGFPGTKKECAGQDEERAHYITPPSSEILTSSVHNDLGTNVLRTWPTLYDGTCSPHGQPAWWQKSPKVDVLICGAGPSGLQIALSLARQGVSFRIVDKAASPLIAGRADGVQPRFLEALHSWGLATEVHEEGPIIERTAIYKDGKQLFFGRSHQSDSRYKGLHIITQGQLERIYVRDLLRHRVLVERQTIITDFDVDEKTRPEWPVQAILRDERSGAEETVSAKFLVGSDGATSMIRKRLSIPFDGISTNIYWGIMDCVFESDYPLAWVFGFVISSQHGGCIVIPRGDGYIRLYTQLNSASTEEVAESRQPDTAFQESGGRVDVHSITPDEVLAQANKIFAPWTLKFAAPLSWFAVWKVSERVARSFSSPDHRVHIAGDAAHVHSVMGAFGLNASLMDSANLAWKLGLCARNLASLSVLGPTYDEERRLHANCIIRVSGSYLRFISNSTLPVADFETFGHNLPPLPDAVSYTPGQDSEFLNAFFAKNGMFLLGLDANYAPNVLSPKKNVCEKVRPIAPRNGVRAPNPRLCFSRTTTGYLYDALRGASMIHIVIFASDLEGPALTALSSFSATLARPDSFYTRYGSERRFNLVIVAKCLPFEAEGLLAGEELKLVRDKSTVLFDDRPPDEDAHTCYEVDHGRGAVVVVRPDLYIGDTFFLDECNGLQEYFGRWLLPV